ncbi:MAG: hypothetical protein QNM02_15035 [Acidimicrobiia bacterium]|nr:hypothetical protein [Acidimicrobiia bacterium]
MDRGSAADLHARPIAEPAKALVRVQDFTSPTFVLGSNQDDEIVDRAACERSGVEIVRRRSGGGGVLLVPGEVTWLDVIVPRDSSGWSDDVHQPMIWLGHHLLAVLDERMSTVQPPVPGEPDSGRLAVHETAFQGSRWSWLLCFDGLGAGEVTLEGRKLVGISQRRTRDAARLQCSWYSRFDWGTVLALIAPRSRAPESELANVATVPPQVSAESTAIAADLAARLSDG